MVKEIKKTKEAEKKTNSSENFKKTLQCSPLLVCLKTTPIFPRKFIASSLDQVNILQPKVFRGQVVHLVINSKFQPIRIEHFTSSG